MATSSRHVPVNVSNKSSIIRSAWNLRIGIVAMLIAVLAVHASMFRKNFAYTPGDQSDAAGIAWFIERDYLWVTGAEHGSYWDSPMLYPQRDTATYSDTLLGGLPFYAPIRAAGADPQTAFQLWILIAGCLNYLSLYILLKKLLGYGEIASNAGAFLFAFGSSRMMQEWHPQLVPECYVVLSLAGLIFLFRDEKRRPIWGAALFFGGLLLQIYTGVYWAFFLVFCVVLALVFALCRRDWRNPLLNRLREQAWPIGGAAVASLVLVAPLMVHSVHTAQQVGTRSYEEVRYLLPGWTSWFQQMPGCLVYGRLYGFFDSHRNPSWWEDSNGLGFATTAMICLGFWAGRRRPLVALLGLVSVASVILTLRLPSGWSLWAGVYSVFPGANGVRAICRIAVFLTLPFAVAAATWIQGRAPRAGLLLAAILVLEQVGTLSSYEKRDYQFLVDRTSETLRGQKCEAFLFSPSKREVWSPALAHTVAMWTSLSTGIPTVNAWTSAYAPGWAFYDTRVSTTEDIARLRTAIAKWRDLHDGYPRSLCWIHPDLAHGSDDAVRTLVEH